MNSACPKLKNRGYCSHSHSLDTLHNRQIILKQLPAAVSDPNAFDKVAQMIRTSESKSSAAASYKVARFSISDDDNYPKSKSDQV